MPGKVSLKLIKRGIDSLYDDDLSDVPEVPLAISEVQGEEETATEVSLNLTGRPKLVFVFGAGGAGKSTILRWMAERAFNEGRALSLATADVRRPTLRRFFSDVDGPGSEEGAAAWVDKAIGFLMRQPMNAAIDFPADMTLAHSLRHAPDLHEIMDRAGITPVVLYMLTPRTEDLTVLAQMEAVNKDAGFRPEATALVMNTAKALDPGQAMDEFRRIRQHSAFRSVVDRGGVQLWMPFLPGAQAILERGISFTAAAKSETDLLAAKKVHHWWFEMEHTFAPITRAGWLP